MFGLLSSIYPEYNWHPWKFSQSPRGYWDDIRNQRKFMDCVRSELNIRDMSDWYKVSYKVQLYLLVR